MLATIRVAHGQLNPSPTPNACRARSSREKRLAKPAAAPAAAGGDIDAVHFEGSFAAAGFDLNPRSRTGDPHTGGGVVIHCVLAFLPRERAAIAGGKGDPARQAGVLDAVGDQLGRLVEVVAARLVGRAVEREVAVGLRIRNQGRGEVFPGIPRIDADAAGIWLRFEG